MANLSKTTQDHEEIQRWAEERGGKPSHVKSTGSGDDVGILRIDFPGYSGEGSLEEIPWEDWFEKFDQGNLALLYEESTAEGQKSNFNKIVSAETAAANDRKGRKSAAKKKVTATKKKAASPAKKGSPVPMAKTSVKKTAAKKAITKLPAKKTASKKTVAKKVAVKQTAPKKAAGKKTAPKKVAAKKAVKKTAAKKSTAKKRR